MVKARARITEPKERRGGVVPPQLELNLTAITFQGQFGICVVVEWPVTPQGQKAISDATVKLCSEHNESVDDMKAAIAVALVNPDGPKLVERNAQPAGVDPSGLTTDEIESLLPETAPTPQSSEYRPKPKRLLSKDEFVRALADLESGNSSSKPGLSDTGGPSYDPRKALLDHYDAMELES